MPANGSKVGVREFYKEIAELRKEQAAIADAQSKERASMETRLVQVIQDVNSAVEARILEQVRCNRADIETLQGDVVGLKVADRRWGGIVGLFSAALAGLVAWFSR